MIPISDFARTITSNGNGTDHGWGGHSLVFGGAVNGSQIYGNIPSLDLQGDFVIGNGIIIPEISCVHSSTGVPGAHWGTSYSPTAPAIVHVMSKVSM